MQATNMEISVCVGSSCHLKGSYQIINALKEKLEVNHLEELVTLKAAFCLGNCVNGVSIKIDDFVFTGIKQENFDQFFDQNILKVLK